VQSALHERHSGDMARRERAKQTSVCSDGGVGQASSLPAGEKPAALAGHATTFDEVLEE
jgi:hypothetical protein